MAELANEHDAMNGKNDLQIEDNAITTENSGEISREEALTALRGARERAKNFRNEAESREHKEYWGGRLSAHNFAIDLLEENHERV